MLTSAFVTDSSNHDSVIDITAAFVLVANSLISDIFGRRDRALMWIMCSPLFLNMSKHFSWFSEGDFIEVFFWSSSGISSKLNGRHLIEHSLQIKEKSVFSLNHLSYWVTVMELVHFTCVHFWQWLQSTALLVDITPFWQIVHGNLGCLVFFGIWDLVVGVHLHFLVEQV